MQDGRIPAFLPKLTLRSFMLGIENVRSSSLCQVMQLGPKFQPAAKYLDLERVAF